MNTATAPVRAEQLSEPFGVKRVLIGGATLIYFGARRRRPAPETSGV